VTNTAMSAAIVANRGKGNVAVLGAGIMGCCTALELARRGLQVTLFDEANAAMTGASRWNEGKIHLGHLYSATGSLATAHRVLRGGLLFKPIVESLIERPLADWTTGHDDAYLLHRDSVTSVEASLAHYRAVNELAATHPDAGHYLAPLTAVPSVALTATELDAVADTKVIVAGMRVPERSICTQRVADALARRVSEDPAIEVAFGLRVEAVRRGPAGNLDAWQVVCDSTSFGPFAAVVNALWHGRPRIDAATLGRSDVDPYHRYRVAAFVDSDPSLPQTSAVIAVGPFGDVKSYGNGRYYVSWYPDGLLAEGSGPLPPEVPVLDGTTKKAIAAHIAGAMSAILPATADIFRRASNIAIEGGWVYSKGQGVLSDPASALHRRDRIGVELHGSYVSIDTGKYSVAPMVARQVSHAICRVAA
jgi:glycine/D-amino acid oxidase-like deaminating enzyme